MRNVPPFPAQSYVYVIGDPNGPQKIGVAKNPKSRLASLQTASVAKLVVSAAMSISPDLVTTAERYAHWLLREEHLSGEWFSVSPEAACSAVEQAIIAVSDGKYAPCLNFGGAGRRPIRPGTRMKQFTHWLNPHDVARMHAFAGKQNMSAYVRSAISEKLEQDEAPNACEAGEL